MLNFLYLLAKPTNLYICMQEQIKKEVELKTFPLLLHCFS